MILITYEKMNDKTGKVTSIAYNPIPEMYPEEKYFLVDQAVIPDREDIPNMDAYLRIDLETKEMYYDYIAQSTFEMKISALELDNSKLKQADLDNKELITVLYEMIMTGGM